MMYEADWDYTLELTQKVDDSVVGRLLRGAYDMHVHIEPEPWMTRRYDTLDTALHAREMGLAGFVLGPVIIVLLITTYRMYIRNRTDRSLSGVFRRRSG